jgi:hypothetical protein
VNRERPEFVDRPTPCYIAADGSLPPCESATPPQP